MNKKILQAQQIFNDLFDEQIKKKDKKTQQKLGIVHTPIETVEFMIDSQDDVTKEEYNLSIYDKDVRIFDPFLGTGTFIIVYLCKLAEKRPENLLYKYENDVFANEILKETYDIAKENIENVFFQLSGIKKEFKNINNVDTFDTY